MKNPFTTSKDEEKQEALKEINEISMAERTTSGQVVIDIDGFNEASYEDCEEQAFDITGKEVLF